MAKNRAMTQSVVVGKDVLEIGDEDKLAANLPQVHIDELVNKGILVGDWSNAAAPEERQVADTGAASSFGASSI